MTETVSEWKERFLKEQEEKKAKEMEEFERKQKANALKEVCRTEEFPLPDGDYYVGCPALVLPEDRFEEFCKEFDGDGLHEWNGHKFARINTGGDGFWHLYDMNWNNEQWDDDGNLIEGPVHIDSLPTDVATLSIMPLELLESLGCDMDDIEEHGRTFEVWGSPEDPFFGVEFKYKMYEGFKHEELSHVEFLWYKLNCACQYMEADADED